MKSKLIEYVINYPCLMIYEGNVGECKMVVLFHKEEHGTVVSSKNGTHIVGTYLISWNMKHFKPFKGEIVLSN